MSERIIPIDNNLRQLGQHNTFTVVIAEQVGGPKFFEGKIGTVLPNPDQPLILHTVEEFGDGITPFAGNAQGIESIIVNSEEGPVVVYHNSNIEFPYNDPGSIDIREGLEPLLQWRVQMGLFPDLQSAQATQELLENS